MEEFKDKTIVDSDKYNNLKSRIEYLQDECKKLKNTIFDKRGYFEMKYSRSQYDYNQSEYTRFFEGYESPVFHGRLKGSPIDKAIINMENLIKDYEDKIFDLFRIIAMDKKYQKKIDDVSVHLGRDFIKIHYKKIEDLEDELRNKILKEEYDKIKSKKIKDTNDKLNKIPYWIRVIFKAI